MEMKVSLKALFTLNWTILYSSLFLYFSNNLFLKDQFSSNFFQDHFNDFLFLPLLNSISFLGLKTLYSKRLPWLLLFLINFVLGSILFEYIFPKIEPKQTGDILDVIAYFCGLVSYLILFAIYDTNNLLHIRRRKT